MAQTLCHCRGPRRGGRALAASGIVSFFFFFGIHSSQFNGPLRRKASPLYRFVTHIGSHGSAGRRVGWHTSVPPKGEVQCGWKDRNKGGIPGCIPPLPSPGVMGNYGGARGAGSYHCWTPVLQTNERRSCDVHIQGVCVGVAVPGTGRLGVSRFKNRQAKSKKQKGKKQLAERHTRVDRLAKIWSAVSAVSLPVVCRGP